MVEDDAKRFFMKHHKAVKKMIPSHLPGSFKSFNGFLQEIFPDFESSSNSPIGGAGKNATYLVSRMRAFLALAFPPVIVGSLAGEQVQFAERGKSFPQFSHASGSTVKCEICLPHQKWALRNHQKHHKIKSKKISIQNILDGSGILKFSGVAATEEHSRSKCHQDALNFFTEDKQISKKIAAPSEEKTARRSFNDITRYFKVPLK